MNVIRTTRICAGLIGLAFTAVLWPAAQAQTETKSRAEVKEDTRAANKAGQLTPAGEAGPADKQKPAASTKTRSQRKSETIEARKKGELLPGGEATYKSSMSQKDANAKSTKTRAERKAETLQAAKEKKLTPAGEVADPAKK